MRGTVAAIERSLLRDGFVARYTPHEVDGLPPGEGAFLPCSFWLADNYALQGRRAEAVAMFERLRGWPTTWACSPRSTIPQRRLLGNFPQAFTHVSLINTALNLAEPEGPVEQRRQ